MIHMIGAITAFFFKYGMIGSHVKFLTHLATFNIPAVATHYRYALMFKVARPWLSW